MILMSASLRLGVSDRRRLELILNKFVLIRMGHPIHTGMGLSSGAAPLVWT